MKHKQIFFFAAAFFVLMLLPAKAEGSPMVINEVAWMGTSVSANNEWMELYNTSSSAVDLTGWTLEATDGSPKIALTGNVASGGYFLLERTDDSAVPSIQADQIYSGALSNSGEILILRDAQGLEVDRVDGSNNWAGIGGDNNTKQTAQRTQNGWITAEPTPRGANAVSTSSAQGASTSSAQGASTSSAQGALGSQTETSTSTAPVLSNNIPVQADAGENIIAEVGQEIFFDSSRSTGRNLSFLWNMGNGETKKEKNFLYNYAFPGKYLVTLFVGSGVSQSQSQIEVIIYPKDIFISEFYSGKDKKSGWVEIHNNSENFVDISLWKLDNGGDVFEIPRGTFLAAGGYLVFSSDVLGSGFVNSSGELFLLYPNGQASDKVKYEFKNKDFSASRKNKNEFVFTKNKTPGSQNVTTYSDEASAASAKEASVGKNIGVSKNLISENWASFVSVNGAKSFLAEPAYAMVSGEYSEAPENAKKLNLSANASSLFSGELILNIFFAAALFLLGFLFARKYFKK
ncbi:lamin tail domain-containing protein [Candidatus Azambacteria bacterium]|nr:lamin tail domain-containing protein [Candidatus Azambacteria bacterium]